MDITYEDVERMCDIGDLDALLPVIHSKQFEWTWILECLAMAGHLDQIRHVLGLNLDPSTEADPYRELMYGAIIGEHLHIIEWACTQLPLEKWIIRNAFLHSAQQNFKPGFDFLYQRYGLPDQSLMYNLLSNAMVRNRREMFAYLFPLFLSSNPYGSAFADKVASLKHNAKPYPYFTKFLNTHLPSIVDKLSASTGAQIIRI